MSGNAEMIFFYGDIIKNEYMGKKRNKISQIGRKKTIVSSIGKFYVVDIDHIEKTSMAHPTDIESLESIYPNIGKAIESIYHIGDKKNTPYPPIGKRVTLQGIKKRGNKKRSSIYPPLKEMGVFEVKLGRVGSICIKKGAFLSPTEDLLDKIAKLTGKAISSPLREKIVGSVYPPIGIVLVEKGDIIKVIKNNGRK